MTIGKRTVSLITVLTVCIFVALATMFFAVSPPVLAEEQKSAELVPIEANDSVAYHCFDEPNSVYADEIGILIAGERSVEYISSENTVTLSKNIAADKVYRKIAREGDTEKEYLIVLRDGRILSHCGEASTVLDVPDATGKINDFCVDGTTLYAVTATELISAKLGTECVENDSVAVTALSSSDRIRINATAITSINGQIYVAVDSAYVRKQDICTVSLGALDVIIAQSDPVLSMTADGDALYTLTRSHLTRYALSDAGALHTDLRTDGTPFADICAYGGDVYALDTLNALHKLSGTLDADKTLIASSSAELGFFNMPSDVAAKNAALYVADTLNGRIVVYTADKVYSPARAFAGPVSVAADSAGTVYVAHDFGKVSAFRTNELSSADETVLVRGELGNVKQIATDADKNLYILASTGLWKTSRGAQPVCLDETRYKAMALGVGRDRLYALSDSEIVVFDTNGTPAVRRPAPKNAVAVSADMDGTIFVLTRTGIVRIATDKPTVEFALAANGAPYSLGSSNGKLLLCSVQNAFVSHGDMIVLDAARHRMYKTSGLALGAKFVDENFVVPNVSGDTVPSAPSDGLIRTVLHDTQVFAFPMESQSIFSIVSGHKVIVPYYDIEETREYSLILIDDTENNRLVQGYVYRDSLSAPIEYVDPPNNICTIFSEVTPVYKWPSRFAKALDGHAAVTKNSKFDMLSFVDAYKDDFGYYWYRIKLESGDEGYIPAVNITTTDYNKQNILPDYNAEIISYNGSSSAPTYVLDEGKYIQIDGISLKTGTRIEVVGAYDSSEYYTQIRYLDEKSHQTVTCYVQTVYIQYNGVNIVLIVAIIVIAITVILAAIIITRTMRSKKKRLEKENYKSDAKD